jgi:bla regulator protein blaR1
VLIVAGCIALATSHAQTSATSGSKLQSENNQTEAQDNQTPLPQYEVASIKTHKSEGMRMMISTRLTPDGVSFSGVTLSLLLSQAFGLPDSRILNQPEWAKSDRYDIEAKVNPAEAAKLEKMTPQQRMAMMLPVLEDRFGLKFHHETKATEVYALVVDKGGPKLQPANADANQGGAFPTPPPDAGMKPNGDGPFKSGEAGGAGAPGGPSPGTKPPPQGAMMMQMSTQGMTVRGRGVTTAQLAEMIGRTLGGTVVDKTGLTGKYDYTLNFAPEMGGGPMAGMPPASPPPSAGAQPSGADTDASAPQSAPSIFTAVREQLGLKLQAKKEPVDVIVIDHIEQPSPN